MDISNYIQVDYKDSDNLLILNNFKNFKNIILDNNFDLEKENIRKSIFIDSEKLGYKEFKDILEEYENYLEELKIWPKEEEIIGRCQVHECIGKGGTSNVYRACHQFLGINVAVKILSNKIVMNNPVIEELFLQEAKNTARLRHPNIVAIFDADKTDRYTYMVMELIDGVTLDTIITKSLKINYVQAINIMLEVCEALKYAQKNNYIHRDIKPANIMLTKSFEVKVLDLGLSTLTNALKNSNNNDLLGTPIYMAPLQFIAPNDISFKADMYAMGVTFFHIITGELPYKSEEIGDLIKEKLNGIDIDFIKDFKLPLGLESLLIKLMDKDPDKRFNSYEELIKILNGLKNTLTIY